MKSFFVTVIFLLLKLQFFGQTPKSKVTCSNVNYSIEIPEVQELIFVIFSLTDVGLNDSIMINHNSEYYKNVISYFGAFKKEKIVRRLGKKISVNYNELRMDASNYKFDSIDNLVKNAEFHNLSWGGRDYLQKYLTDLEAFSKKTQFRKFYETNKDYYDALIDKMKLQAPIDKQQKWLENNFPKKHANFRIVFSPLSYGKHSTNSALKDVVIFVSSPTENSKLSKILLEARDTRMLFTEIDHNYVNPISDSYLTQIKKAFKEREKWTNGKYSDSYKDEYAVFNEYMTWCVFVLYALDTYNIEDYNIVKNQIETMMIEYRGFSNFKVFNEKMIELYKNKESNVLISDLFLEILNWCEKQ